MKLDPLLAALDAVRANGAPSTSMVAAAAGVSRAQARDALADGERRGVLERVRGRWRLTPRGRAVLEHLDAITQGGRCG